MPIVGLHNQLSCSIAINSRDETYKVPMHMVYRFFQPDVKQYRNISSVTVYLQLLYEYRYMCEKMHSQQRLLLFARQQLGLTIDIRR